MKLLILLFAFIGDNKRIQWFQDQLRQRKLSEVIPTTSGFEAKGIASKDNAKTCESIFNGFSQDLLWVVVTTTVPFVGPLNIRCRIIVRTQTNNFDSHSFMSENCSVGLSTERIPRDNSYHTAEKPYILSDCCLDALLQGPQQLPILRLHSPNRIYCLSTLSSHVRQNDVIGRYIVARTVWPAGYCLMRLVMPGSAPKR